MGEYQSRNGLNMECPTCHTIYNDRDGCQTCKEEIRSKIKDIDELLRRDDCLHFDLCYLRRDCTEKVCHACQLYLPQIKEK